MNSTRVIKRCSKITLIVLTVVITILGNVLLKLSIEDFSRHQARYNLEQIKYCDSIASKYMDRIKGLQLCTAKLRIGFSGDVYVLDANTKKFVVENSADVPSDDLYFTKDSVGKYFNDWSTGKKAIKYILMGKDSDEYTKAWYLFDNSVEWLEWKYLPDSSKYYEGRKLIVVHGIQSDEAYAYFKTLQIVWFSFAGILIFFLLTMHHVQLNYNYGRRADDEQRK